MKRIPEGREFITVVRKTDLGKAEIQEWRVIDKFKLVYSTENGNDPEPILLMQPVQTMIDVPDYTSPSAFAVLDCEFWDIFQLAE